MDTNKLLNNYQSLPINISDVQYLLTDQVKKRIYGSSISDVNKFLNNMLYKLLDTYYFDDKNKLIGDLHITKDGMKYDTSLLVSRLHDYYQIPDDVDSIKYLENLKNTTIDKVIYGNENILNDYYKAVALDREYSKVKKVKLEFVKTLCKNINKYIDLIRCRATYEHVNLSLFDEDKLSLYLAGKVKDYAVLCKSKKQKKEYLNALKYLNKYVDNNKDMIESDYTYHINGDRYSAKSISLFLKRNITKKEKVIKQIVKYPYNFLEYKNEEGNAILTSMIVDGMAHPNYKKNSSELMRLLKNKLEFYNSLDYEKVLIGRDSFNGYVGFELDCGYVILDKFFDDRKEGIIADCEAIYIVNHTEFESITKMSKKEVMKDIKEKDINVKRISHYGDFGKRVKEYVKLK